MEEDAEYCALAKNIAGEARSSAQLIVEPKNKPESVPKPKSPKTETKKETKGDLYDISYLRTGRLRSSSGSSSLPKASKSRSTSESDTSLDRKDENNLTNLGQKLAMTKDSVSDVAEDMLSASKEVSRTEHL